MNDENGWLGALCAFIHTIVTGGKDSVAGIDVMKGGGVSKRAGTIGESEGASLAVDKRSLRALVVWLADKGVNVASLAGLSNWPNSTNENNLTDGIKAWVGTVAQGWGTDPVDNPDGQYVLRALEALQTLQPITAAPAPLTMGALTFGTDNSAPAALAPVAAPVAAAPVAAAPVAAAPVAVAQPAQPVVAAPAVVAAPVVVAQQLAPAPAPANGNGIIGTAYEWFKKFQDLAMGDPTNTLLRGFTAEGNVQNTSNGVRTICADVIISGQGKRNEMKSHKTLASKFGTAFNSVLSVLTSAWGKGIEGDKGKAKKNARAALQTADMARRFVECGLIVPEGGQLMQPPADVLATVAAACIAAGMTAHTAKTTPEQPTIVTENPAALVDELGL